MGKGLEPGLRWGAVGRASNGITGMTLTCRLAMGEDFKKSLSWLDRLRVVKMNSRLLCSPWDKVACVQPQNIATNHQIFAVPTPRPGFANQRSEEHTSELQSRENLVCRLLLEK